MGVDGEFWISVVGYLADLQEILAVDEFFELSGVELYPLVCRAGQVGEGTAVLRKSAGLSWSGVVSQSISAVLRAS